MFHVEQKVPVIAIDGPGGVGKSTTARELAEALGYYFLSTGIIYRAMAWRLLERGWNPADPPDTAMLEPFSLRIDPHGALWINGKLLEADLHAEAISRAASVVSAHAAIREKSNQIQRETVRLIGEEGSFPGVILEGRDIGTVVFPDAAHKFFLTADEAIRAERRFLEQQQKGDGVSREAVHAGLRERDGRDTSRAEAPLVAAADAVQIDTSAMTLPEVVHEMLGLITHPRP